MILIPYPYYIKKEDVRDVVRGQRTFLACVLIGISIVFGIMQFSVAPKVVSLYTDLNYPTPFITQISPYVMTASILLTLLVAFYLLFAKPDFTKIDAVASKYKDGEMIKTKELFEGKYAFLGLASLLLMVGLLVFGTILPIQSLMNQL